MKKLLMTMAALIAMQTATAAGWSPITKLTTVYPNNDGNIYGYNLANSNPDGCSSAAFVVQSTNPAKKEIYAALLGAKLANANIQLYLSGCMAGIYPIVLHVQLVP